MKLNKDNLLFIFLLVILILLISFYFIFNTPYQSKEIKSVFGTYLDKNSFSKGYNISTCVIESVDIFTDKKASFYFGCHIKIEENETAFPIGFLTTFPFNIKYITGICELPMRVYSNGTKIIGEEDCLNIMGDIDKGYILRGQFNNYKEINRYFQFSLEGEDIFYRISNTKLRFKMPLAKERNELYITGSYCNEIGFPDGCLRLKMPNELKLNIRIPRNSFEIDFSNSYPKFSLEDDGEAYIISWNIKDTDFIQFDMIDKEKEYFLNNFNFIITLLIGFISGLLTNQFSLWLNNKKRNRDKIKHRIEKP